MYIAKKEETDRGKFWSGGMESCKNLCLDASGFWPELQKASQLESNLKVLMENQTGENKLILYFSKSVHL